jgi:hypothetical protein
MQAPGEPGVMGAEDAEPASTGKRLTERYGVVHEPHWWSEVLNSLVIWVRGARWQ